jgi:nucleoside-triphosphatase
MKHILLTGLPRTGKTTLLKTIISKLDSCGGFYTEEILNEDKKRMGFKIKTLDGKEGILALKGISSKFKLGKYGINLKDLEEIALPSVKEALKNKSIIVIDEIGKMELFSEKFKNLVLEVLDSGKPLLGVIHKESIEFLNKIRKRKDVEVLEVNLNNHQDILYKVFSLLK